MSTVTVTLQTTPTSLPASGVTFSHYQYAIATNVSGAPGAAQQPAITSSEKTVSFPEDVPAGDYFMTAGAIGSDGNFLGDTHLTVPFTVPVPTYDAPTSLTVALS